MDVVITTSDPGVVTAKDAAVALITAIPNLYYVRSVKVIDRDTGNIADWWGAK